MIRVANYNDIPYLIDLINESSRGLLLEDYSKESIELLLSDGHFGVDQDLIEDQTYFVITENNEYLACGGWSKRRKLWGSNSLKNEKTNAYLDSRVDSARIRAFFINPKYARRGLGRKLLEHCENQALKHGFRRTELMATLTGVKFYKARGYIEGEPYKITFEKSPIVVEFISMGKNLS